MTRGRKKSEGPIRERWLSKEDAEFAVRRFENRFGPKALHLACHAALPLILSPELVHLIRINFLEAEGIPGIAEADLLLSHLCRPLDEPLYEMEPRIRESLLNRLTGGPEDPSPFPEDRPWKIAEFLMAWLCERPVRKRTEDENKAHEWVMQAWLNPGDAVSRLKKELDMAGNGVMRRADRYRLVKLTEALAAPLSRGDVAGEYRELVDWSRKVAEILYGLENGKTSETREPGSIQVVTLETGGKPVDLEFTWIPPGEFMMGSPEDEPNRYKNESPLHRVTIETGFYMQTTPVTQAQWEAVMGNNPSDFKNAGPDAPVENVSWNDAKEFIMAWLCERPVRKRTEDETKAHEWVMQAWLSPGDAVSRLKKELDMAGNGVMRRADRYRLVKLTEALAVPLSRGDVAGEYRELVDWSRKEAGILYGLENGKTSETREPGSIQVVTLETGGKPVDLEFTWIPPGEFMMGSPEDEPGRDSDESPRHKVTISEGFYMQTTPVTQGQWEAVMGNNPSDFDNAGPDAPVEEVSWDDAKKFITRLNKLTGQKFRLPSEAEWEYACRAGTDTPFYTGNCLSSDTEANYNGNYPLKGCPEGRYRETTTPVKTFPANPWGLYDMHGNVYEWVEDYWHGDYKGAPADGSPRIDSPRGALRVCRGGSWYCHAGYCRSAYRDWRDPSGRNDGFGFRLVLSRGQK